MSRNKDKKQEQEVVEETTTESVEETVIKPEETTDSVEVDELAEAKAALEEMENKYLRVQAEMANIQKRNAKEREDAAKFRAQSLALELLPVGDNLERALAIEVTDEQGKSLKKGIEMVKETFAAALKNEGIEVIDPLNEPFDPNFHQAVQTVPVEEGQKSEIVVQVLQKGYDLKGRVLRPAMVIVAQ
ncbi:molecular chaperone GrpE [Carnobacterium alterfunditum]|uniref:Protein GrpE n=1 Tax=Carnobacterium alterfunditum TaxID=28230 RepID=A0A1N6GZ16_9LACT|nr:nucleotide exchange factor GrpE [Carnobacterium alterfunditum]SIO12687.1 molecular chaperone GrpE [Carnobacterium alterfunditum]